MLFVTSLEHGESREDRARKREHARDPHDHENQMRKAAGENGLEYVVEGHERGDEHRGEDKSGHAVPRGQDDRRGAVFQGIDYRGGSTRRAAGRTRSVTGYSRPCDVRIELAYATGAMSTARSSCSSSAGVTLSSS